MMQALERVQESGRQPVALQGGQGQNHRSRQRWGLPEIPKVGIVGSEEELDVCVHQAEGEPGQRQEH